MSLASPAIVRVTTPCEAHQKWNKSSEKKNVTNPIKSLELLSKRLLASGGTRRGLDGEKRSANE